MGEPCPGSKSIPVADTTGSGSRPRGECRYCRRDFAVTADGTLRMHKGKPVTNGCPYKCPGPECDFACYHPAVPDA